MRQTKREKEREAEGKRKRDRGERRKKLSHARKHFILLENLSDYAFIFCRISNALSHT